MNNYMIPTTEVVSIETKLCQINAQSQTQDQGAPQFAPRREGEIID
jgi:hypothetical protein